MRILNTKKKTKIATTAIVMLAIGGTAYGFWTSTGSGTGNATTGTTVAVTVNQTSTVTGLAPGEAAQALSGDFSNTNSGAVTVPEVTATVTDVQDSTGTSIALACPASNYTIGGPGSATGIQVPHGDHVGAWSGLTVAMNDSTTDNQDACKGATVVISYATS